MKVKTVKASQNLAAYADKMMVANSNPITESWAPSITKVTGVTDPAKLEWMSQLAHNTAKALNEDAFVMPSNGFASFGGTYAPYNNLYNTVGVGNAVPAGRPALTGADYADSRNLGSGDKFPALLPLALKVAAKTIGFELVNTMPFQNPNGVLPYMDYVYSGSKQPYGATPAHDPRTANPHMNSQSNSAFELYGLPHSFKASVFAGWMLEDGNPKKVENVGAVKRALKGATAMPAGTQLRAAMAGSTAPEQDLVVEFIGWSRIDGDPMFKVVSGVQALGSYFAGDTLAFNVVYAPVGTADKITWTLELGAPRLVSMLEDQIQGFTGAGPVDRDPWYGTYQDGTTLYEPMSRATGEQTQARQISLQLFTRNVTVGTIQVGCAVTQEQVTDLQKQWGIDVVKMAENAGINELSATINRHITSRLFALGWKNHYKLVEVEGPAANLNISLDPSYTGKDGARMTPALAIPQGEPLETGEYRSWINVALPYKPLYIPSGAAFENRDTLIKRIASNFLAASNWIFQRGRYGQATFAVTNTTIITLLQTNAQYTFSPIANTLKQEGGQLYNAGTICGLQVYCDPNMGAYDTRVLVGRKGGKDEPGTYFCPYVMAESVQIIAEGTMAPKLQIKSRYALVDAGFYPET